MTCMYWWRLETCNDKFTTNSTLFKRASDYLQLNILNNVSLTSVLFLVKWRHWLAHSWLNLALLFWRQMGLQQSASLPCPVFWYNKNSVHNDQNQAKARVALQQRIKCGPNF